ncbi:MAG: hypothetical protein AAGP08_11285 [Pseudomonadota bacterium]
MQKLVLLCVLVISAGPALGQVSLLDASLFARPQASLVAPNTQNGASDTTVGSLFNGRAEGGLFSKVERVVAPRQGKLGLTGRRGLEGLRDLIGKAEAGRAWYDAVQHGARIKPPKPPTQMTIAEIYAWIDATPGQPHAIGLYQFIPPTLRSVVRKTGVPVTARFTPEVQDALADVLFRDAGIDQFLAGKISQTRFMNNLAKIWAGFPTSNGQSYYHGYAGNFATITWAEFERAMTQIFRRG